MSNSLFFLKRKKNTSELNIQIYCVYARDSYAPSLGMNSRICGASIRFHIENYEDYDDYGFEYI